MILGERVVFLGGRLLFGGEKVLLISMLFSFFPLRNHQRIWVKLQKPTRIIHISWRPPTFENITLIFSACHLASSSAGISIIKVVGMVKKDPKWIQNGSGSIFHPVRSCFFPYQSLIFVMVWNGCMNRVLWEVPAPTPEPLAD